MTQTDLAKNPAQLRVHVRVPATSANLGPGFDTLGLALAYGDEITAELTDTPGIRVNVSGVGEGEVPGDESNLVAKSLLHVFQSLRVDPPTGLLLNATNRIPHGRGMGSSGAAIVAGVKLAEGLLKLLHGKQLTEQQLLEFATELEGHPDNVAPGLSGGLTIAWMSGSTPRSKKLAVHRGVSPLVLVPNFRVSTEHARSLQPEAVPHSDAVFNVSRSALLIAALTQSPELLLEATEDKLHQDYRAEAMPQTRQLIEQLRQAGFAAVVSGAGPSVLVLADGPAKRAEAADFVAENAPDWQRKILAVDIEGATVEISPV